MYTLLELDSQKSPSNCRVRLKGKWGLNGLYLSLSLSQCACFQIKIDLKTRKELLY